MSAAFAQSREPHFITTEDGRRYLVEAPDRIRPQIEVARRQAALTASSPQRLAALNAPATHSLAQFQTAFRDQQDRGTCWAFAGAAALEAAYLRKYNLRLDLSEQYIFHMSKAMAFTPGQDPTNNTSLTGFQGSSDIVAHFNKYAVPEEPFAPYLNGAQMDQLRRSLGVGDMLNAPTQIGYDTFEFSEGHIPTIARWNAKYRVAGYGQVTNPMDTAELEGILAANKEVVVSFDLRWRFNATRDVFEYEPNSSGGGHVMVLIGYDRDQQVFTAKNSWGENRFIRLTYNFIKNCAITAYYINDVSHPNAASLNKARFLGFREFDETVNGVRLNGRLVIRRFTRMEVAEPPEFELESFYPGDGSAPLTVTGFFVRNGDGIVLHIHYRTGSQWSYHIISYDCGFWRFVDKNYTGTYRIGTMQYPLTDFIEATSLLPRKGDVIVQPGAYYAVGVYTKPMTLKAPSRGVSLGNGN